MKKTGIVRRIDELGRIVIPKEIRRTLMLREGSQMEIYTTMQNELILKKFSLLQTVDDYAENFCSSLQNATGRNFVVCDADKVIACAGVSKKEYLEKEISEDLQKLLNERKVYILNVSENTTTYPIINGDKVVYTSQIIAPIIVAGDIVGGIIMFVMDDKQTFTTYDVKLLQTVSNIFANLLSE